MARPRGLQTEVLLSLLVVMVTATAVLGGAWVRTHAAHVEQLRGLTMRALTEAARSSLPIAPPSPAGTPDATTSTTAPTELPLFRNSSR